MSDNNYYVVLMIIAKINTAFFVFVTDVEYGGVVSVSLPDPYHVMPEDFLHDTDLLHLKSQQKAHKHSSKVILYYINSPVLLKICIYGFCTQRYNSKEIIYLL